jgi:hypothetical protein
MPSIFSGSIVIRENFIAASAKLFIPSRTSAVGANSKSVATCRRYTRMNKSCHEDIRPHAIGSGRIEREERLVRAYGEPKINGISAKSLKCMAHPERFELPTPRFVVWCSIQLSYGCVSAFADASADYVLGPAKPKRSRTRGRRKLVSEAREGKVSVRAFGCLADRPRPMSQFPPDGPAPHRRAHGQVPAPYRQIPPESRAICPCPSPLPPLRLRHGSLAGSRFWRRPGRSVGAIAPGGRIFRRSGDH